MKRTIAILLGLLLLAGCAAPAASPSPTAAATAEATAAQTAEITTEPKTAAPEVAGTSVTDFLGNDVTVDKVPERIVSMTPTNTEIIYALGLGDKLVGVDAFSDYPAEAAELTKIGDFNGPNLETVASLNPDLVLAGNKLQRETVDQLQALGLTVAAVEATAYADVVKSIEMVGVLTGTQEQAATLVAQMKADEEAVLDTVADATGDKVVYYAMSYGDSGNWTGGPGSFPYELIELCGGKSITEGFPVPWVDYNLEDLIKKDPDIILLSSDLGDVATFAATAPYSELTAVKEDRVYTVNANLSSRPGPRIVEGLKEFADAITGATAK